MSKVTKPFLKWAGGKTQLLEELKQYIPSQYNYYIEPFLGGGALFFYLKPSNAILADINPELINCYKIVRDNVDDLIKNLENLSNDEHTFYNMRSMNPLNMDDVSRAVRFIYLNRTCFNGLYRENKKGEFNVPFGRYKKPTICDRERLYECSNALQGAKIICGDYKAVLRRYAQQNDFIFLDPPYVPLGGTADFHRYTKNFFYDSDHIELRNEVNRLVSIGAKIILTNSNTLFVNELYTSYAKKVANTKRLISSNVNTRVGEDLIVYSIKSKRTRGRTEELLENFPSTRYMGSKYKILPFLWDSIKELEFDTVLDAFSGSCCVSYMLKKKGMKVYSNDFMAFSANIAKALIENSNIILDEKDLEILFQNNSPQHFIQETFKGLYFDDEDNIFLDNTRYNVGQLTDPYKQSIALAALSRACMKKRPRGIFTFTGERYDDGRRDLRLSLREHFLENVNVFNSAVFDNKKENKAFNQDIFNLKLNPDLVYFDPPYLTSKSDNDYTRRYHFVEGLIKNWKGLSIDYQTKTKKFKKYPSLFDSKNTINNALDRLFNQYQNSILVISYSSNSIPTKEEMMNLLKKYKKEVELKEIDYTYSFGNQGEKMGNNANRVKEYLFIAK